ncbi:hypothetical protein SBF1_2400002 [Candidatus Desulfosporosinus infrequens]|uniref:Uncharacterized protein n=1 Tax=Candidatus Desulfosporosinus infrequens TaxID=2043169 RepID=A0A2U3KNF2_9FIRM|nr:hypothetical protein SBF1_2400002 [Candidatus Desulfosporosinus infrequens]
MKSNEYIMIDRPPSRGHFSLYPHSKRDGIGMRVNGHFLERHGIPEVWLLLFHFLRFWE